MEKVWQVIEKRISFLSVLPWKKKTDLSNQIHLNLSDFLDVFILCFSLVSYKSHGKQIYSLGINFTIMNVVV